MAIKYIHVPEQKKTIAVLEETKYDAVKKISKILCSTGSLYFDPNKYYMNDAYRSVVVAYDSDEYDPVEGERQAKKKLLKHYYKHLDQKYNMFIKELNTAMFFASIKLPEKKTLDN